MLYMYQEAHVHVYQEAHVHVEMKKLLWKSGWKKSILGVH